MDLNKAFLDEIENCNPPCLPFIGLLDMAKF